MCEHNMKTKLILFLTILFSSVSSPGFAGAEEERIYLIQILNQLHAMKPLIVKAANEQPKTNRIKFHYTKYRDANGHTHNGLIEDINEIEKGIKEKLHQSPSAPRHIQPIKGDYIERTKAWSKS